MRTVPKLPVPSVAHISKFPNEKDDLLQCSSTIFCKYAKEGGWRCSATKDEFAS